VKFLRINILWCLAADRVPSKLLIPDTLWGSIPFNFYHLGSNVSDLTDTLNTWYT
jgi:hypothetical protein